MGANPSIPIAVLGLSGSGKSALCYSLGHKELFGSTEPSPNSLIRTHVEHTNIPLELFDIGMLKRKIEEKKTFNLNHRYYFKVVYFQRMK